MISGNSNHIYVALICLILSGCGVYSFSGASISPEARTISIDYFQNKAPLVQPTLSQQFTDALKDKFTNETNLDLVAENGDLHIEGSIVDYKTRPQAIQGNEVAALNRLTISVKAKFINIYDEKQNFESTFTRFQDYESSLSLSDVEETLIQQINEELVQDIFNKAVVNW